MSSDAQPSKFADHFRQAPMFKFSNFILKGNGMVKIIYLF